MDKKSSLLFLLLPLVISCNNDLTVSELCDMYPAMCTKFKADTWCKAERKKLLFSHHDLITTENDDDKYQVLIKLEDYRECMAYASKIEHIKLKEKRTNRIDNKNNAVAEIKALSKSSINSENPYLLYYHWSRYLNEDALNKFIKLEGSALLEKPELQFFLATYYIKKDIPKTLGLLFHALELYQPSEEINAEIFTSLITIFTDKKEFKQAYIWLKVLSMYKPDQEGLTKNSLTQFEQLHKLDGAFLDKVATSTLNKIQEGKFTAPKF